MFIWLLFFVILLFSLHPTRLCTYGLHVGFGSRDVLLFIFSFYIFFLLNQCMFLSAFHFEYNDRKFISMFLPLPLCFWNNNLYVMLKLFHVKFVVPIAVFILSFPFSLFLILCVFLYFLCKSRSEERRDMREKKMCWTRKKNSVVCM